MVKCPACGHRVRVPGEPRPQPQTADDESGKLQWQGKTNREIGRELRRRRPRDQQKKEIQDTRRAMSSLMPRYDSLTLFALSFGFLLLFWIRSESQPMPLPFVDDVSTSDVVGLLGQILGRVLAGYATVLIPPAVIGMLLSLVGVFYPRPKPKAIKWLMLCFAVVATGGTGLYAGYVAFASARGWLMVFPVWNMITAVLPPVLFRAGLLDADIVLDTPARISQVVATMIAVTVLLLVCLYGFQLDWALSYSICVGYVMSLNHRITDLFGRAPVDQEAAFASRTL
jgi:hypothetical protein